jgi:SAM-dependent methyltransferase
VAPPAPEHLPPTRWSLVGAEQRGYGAHFARLVASGEDVDGEARLADALLPRGARVLDVGSGMGRVAAALQARGHDVLASEPDDALREQSRATYPDLTVLPHQALALDPAEHGGADLVVAVGNVMVYLGEGTERAVLVRLRELLAEGGRVLVGFHPDAVMPGSRAYPPEEFVADAAAAGLAVDHRFGSYELHPPAAEYAVFVLSVRG